MASLMHKVCGFAIQQRTQERHFRIFPSRIHLDDWPKRCKTCAFTQKSVSMWMAPKPSALWRQRIIFYLDHSANKGLRNILWSLVKVTVFSGFTPKSDKPMDAAFHISACNLLVEADCSRFRLAKFSAIIGCLLTLRSNWSGSLAQRWGITDSTEVSHLISSLNVFHFFTNA